MSYRDSEVSPTNILIQFHDLVNRRLSVNLAVLELVIYSSEVVSSSNKDYSLPKPWTTAGLGVMRMILGNRSFGALAGYEGHRKSLQDPNNYIYTNRLDHNFDCLLMPKEMHDCGKLK